MSDKPKQNRLVSEGCFGSLHTSPASQVVVTEQLITGQPVASRVPVGRDGSSPKCQPLASAA